MRRAIPLVCAFLVGCTTYKIPVESFREQLGGAAMQPVIMEGPLGERISYEANTIRTIHCVDKDGQPAELTNGPSIEARFTTSDGRRRTLYFDRLMLRNDTLIGSPSRFLENLVTTIPVASITKVEVQDGNKDFFYVVR